MKIHVLSACKVLRHGVNVAVEVPAIPVCGKGIVKPGVDGNYILPLGRNGEGRYTLIDSAANQRTLSGVKSVAELFCERGIIVDTNVDKDVFSGIARVKSCLCRGNGEPDLYIFEGCLNMIEEFKTYCWADGDAPLKRDDHCMDELRYYLSRRPPIAERSEFLTPLAADKMRRIRRGERARRGLIAPPCARAAPYPPHFVRRKRSKKFAPLRNRREKDRLMKMLEECDD